ncbi:unnamed protein product [Rhizophagus irregularis]|nr:unnamed protein product [Rhizophagus irregularis]
MQNQNLVLWYRLEKEYRISETKLNVCIAEVFAEVDDDDDHDENENLSTETSVQIGKIPNDVLEDDIDESGDEGIDVDDSVDGDKSQREEKGVLDYDIDNLLNEFISEEKND